MSIHRLPTHPLSRPVLSVQSHCRTKARDRQREAYLAANAVNAKMRKQDLAMRRPLVSSQSWSSSLSCTATRARYHHAFQCGNDDDELSDPSIDGSIDRRVKTGETHVLAGAKAGPATWPTRLVPKVAGEKAEAEATRKAAATASFIATVYVFVCLTVLSFCAFKRFVVVCVCRWWPQNRMCEAEIDGRQRRVCGTDDDGQEDIVRHERQIANRESATAKGEKRGQGRISARHRQILFVRRNVCLSFCLYIIWYGCVMLNRAPVCSIESDVCVCFCVDRFCVCRFTWSERKMLTA